MRLVAEHSPFPRLLVFPLLVMAVMFASLARVNPDLMLRSAHCALREGTGVACPTCGGTLAAIRLAEGRPLEAMAANPLITTTALVGGLWSLYALAATIRPRWRRSLRLGTGSARRLRIVAVAAVLANWAYELWAH